MAWLWRRPENPPFGKFKRGLSRGEESPGRLSTCTETVESPGTSAALANPNASGAESGPHNIMPMSKKAQLAKVSNVE